MRNKSLLRVVPVVLLISILLVSFGLRAWGAGFGLPAYWMYHPDEHALVDRAARILYTGDWNLHRFNYPPFYAYVQAGGDAAYFLWGAAQGAWNQIMPFTLPQYYEIGRLITAMVGVLTVLVTYLAGRELRGRRMGLLAAAMLGGCYLHVIHSHYATFDVMVGLLAALTLLFSELILTRREAKWYALAGLCAGVAGATKYNGAIVLLLPLIAHVLTTPWGEWGWLNRYVALTLGGFLVGFFGGNPFAIGNLPDFLNGLATVLAHYGTEQPGFEGSANWRWYIHVFFTSADALWVAGGVLGLVGIVWRQRKHGLLLVAFPLLYYLMISHFVVRFERNLVPVLPFLALGSGWLLDRLAERLARRFSSRPAIGPSSAAVGCILILLLPLSASLSLDRAISRTDLREIAGQWLENHVEAGSRIAIEHYSIPFDHRQFWVQDVMRISDHDLDWYQQEKFDILVISDGVWEILRQDPQRYAEKLATYQELVDNCTLLAEFVPHPPSIAVAGYPTVAVYHFAPVRIYRVPSG